MARMIPKSTKIKVQFFKGINFGDILVVLFALVFLALAWTSAFEIITKLVISIPTLTLKMVNWYSIELSHSKDNYSTHIIVAIISITTIISTKKLIINN